MSGVTVYPFHHSTVFPRGSVLDITWTSSPGWKVISISVNKKEISRPRKIIWVWESQAHDFGPQTGEGRGQSLGDLRLGEWAGRQGRFQKPSPACAWQ